MFSRSEPVRTEVGYILPIENERGKNSGSKPNVPILQDEPLLCAQGSDLSQTEMQVCACLKVSAFGIALSREYM